MTGKPARRQSQPPEQPRADPWQIRFSKLVQVCGLGFAVYEVRWEHSDRPWIIALSAAMMTGGLGLQALARWFMERMQ